MQAHSRMGQTRVHSITGGYKQGEHFAKLRCGNLFAEFALTVIIFIRAYQLNFLSIMTPKWSTKGIENIL